MVDVKEIEALAGKVRSGLGAEKAQAVQALQRLSKILTSRCNAGPFCRHRHSFIGTMPVDGEEVELYAGGPNGALFVFVTPGAEPGTVKYAPATAELLLERPGSAGALASCIEQLAFGEWAGGIMTQPPALA